MTGDVTLEILGEIGAAFSRHDIDAIVSFFAEDGEFVNAIGSEPFGARYVGHSEIRGFFEQLFEQTADVQWEKLDVRITGDKAYSEWHRKATLKNGEKQDWLGVDIYTFKKGKILKKDTYFKVVG
jgi:uncharacterized protein (TIGR02246 family)